MFGSVADRNWETDQAILKNKCDPNEIDDLTEQLVDGKTGSQLRVILGGGRATFRDRKVMDEEKQRGYRGDGKDLIKKWLSKNINTEQRSYVWNAVSSDTILVVYIPKKYLMCDIILIIRGNCST